MRDLKFETAGVLGAGLVAGLFLTTRAERIGAENYEQFPRQGTPFILVFWHGHLLPLVHYHRNQGFVVLVSEHADGEYITRVIERNGFATVRGSSSRGATKALKGLVRAARAGQPLAVTPDGPRGPRGEFKPGALLVAQVTGLPLVPVSVGASSGWRFRSWDGFLVPRPFSKVTLEYAAPRYVPRDATREDLARIAVEMGAQMSEADRRLNPDEIIREEPGPGRARTGREASEDSS